MGWLPEQCHRPRQDDGERPALLFVCHLDVVAPGEEPWRHPPLRRSRTGKIYGRGAVDMKGATAAVVTAICDVVDAKTP